MRTLAPGSRRPRRSSTTPQRTPHVGSHVNAYATGRGTGVFRGSHGVVAALALRNAVDDRRGAPYSTPRPRDPRQQSHVVPRSARARLPRRPPAPPRAIPDEGPVGRQPAPRLPAPP